MRAIFKIKNIKPSCPKLDCSDLRCLNKLINKKKKYFYSTILLLYLSPGYWGMMDDWRSEERKQYRDGSHLVGCYHWVLSGEIYHSSKHLIFINHMNIHVFLVNNKKIKQTCGGKFLIRKNNFKQLRCILNAIYIQLPQINNFKHQYLNQRKRM